MLCRQRPYVVRGKYHEDEANLDHLASQFFEYRLAAVRLFMQHYWVEVQPLKQVCQLVFEHASRPCTMKTTRKHGASRIHVGSKSENPGLAHDKAGGY